MTEQELQTATCPFQVRFKGKRKPITVEGFSQNDPLGVGGGIFPDIPVAHFKNGGWLLVSDLLRHYEMVTP